MADYADDRPTIADKAGSCPRCGRPAIAVIVPNAVCALDHVWTVSAPKNGRETGQ